MIVDLNKISDLVEIEFADLITDVIVTDLNAQRIVIVDGSFIDVWYSLQLEGRYSYHWERRFVDGTIYRHDNIPHLKWKNIPSFPKHFHNGSEENVVSSNISAVPELALREILKFVEKVVIKK